MEKLTKLERRFLEQMCLDDNRDLSSAENFNTKINMQKISDFYQISPGKSPNKTKVPFFLLKNKAIERDVKIMHR